MPPPSRVGVRRRLLPTPQPPLAPTSGPTWGSTLSGHHHTEIPASALRSLQSPMLMFSFTAPPLVKAGEGEVISLCLPFRMPWERESKMPVPRRCWSAVGPWARLVPFAGFSFSIYKSGGGEVGMEKTPFIVILLPFQK